MLTFRPILPEDIVWAGPLLAESGYFSCEFCFTNIFIWQQTYGSRIARFEDFVLVCHEDDEAVFALLPAGRGDLAAALRAMREYAGSRQLSFYSVPPAMRDQIEEVFPGCVTLAASRPNYDYILDMQTFLDLPGSTYQKRRYELRHFARQMPSAAFTPMTPADYEDVRSFMAEWCSHYSGEDKSGIQAESLALEAALTHYDALGLMGGVLRAEGQLLGFSIGSPLNPSVLCGHIQKARHDIRGAFFTVAHEFARMYGSAYRWLNCEDDLGQPGLRAAKLSYHPAWLEEKYMACLKSQSLCAEQLA